jgi:radical SAM-linked protein
MTRVRLRYSKLGKIRFLGHRDVARTLERSLRKIGAPVRYTEGFSPRPRLHFGLALSTGHESLGEYLDVDLDLDDDLAWVAGVADRLSDALPAGLDCVAAGAVDPGAPSLQEAVTSCTWQIDVVGVDEAEATEAVEQVLAAGELLVERTRKGRTTTDDLRPAIGALEVLGPVLGPMGEGVRLGAELATQPRGVRPAELLAGLSPGAVEARVLRVAQWMSPDGAPREEPLSIDATPALHAWMRAS